MQTPKKSRLGRAGGRNCSQRSEYVQETQDHTVLSQNGVLTAELRKRNWLTESFLVVHQNSFATSFSIFSRQKTQVFSWEEKEMTSRGKRAPSLKMDNIQHFDEKNAE